MMSQKKWRQPFADGWTLASSQIREPERQPQECSKMSQKVEDKLLPQPASTGNTNAGTDPA